MMPVFMNVVEECKKNLRYMELEAYAMLVSVMRAQGPMCLEKKKFLKDAGKILHVPTDRHNAEMRRAANDDRLYAIAYHVYGPEMLSEEWSCEGRKPEEAPTEDNTPEREADSDTATSCNVYKRPRLSASYEIVKQKKNPGKSQHKVMIVSNASSSTMNNSILHKPLSLPLTKITKLNLDKFKIVPNSVSSSLHVTTVVNANEAKVKNNKVIPLSQLNILKHRFATKGSIKVLPLKGKFIGKNITMARITPINEIKNVLPKDETKPEEKPAPEQDEEVKSDKEVEVPTTEPEPAECIEAESPVV